MQTSAPRARATAISAPSRTPESITMAACRPPRRAPDGPCRSSPRERSSWRPPWLERWMPSTPAAHRPDGVFGADRPLYQQGPGHQAAQQVDRSSQSTEGSNMAVMSATVRLGGPPGRGSTGGFGLSGRGIEVGKAEHRAAQHVGPVPRVQADVEDGPGAQPGRDGQPVAYVPRPVPGHGRVDRDLQRLVAGGGGPLHQRPGMAAVPQHVQLEPQAGVAGGRQVLDRGGADGRKAVGQSLRLAGRRHRHLTGGVHHPRVPGRGQAQRGRQPPPEQSHGEVGAGHVLQGCGAGKPSGAKPARLAERVCSPSAPPST